MRLLWKLWSCRTFYEQRLRRSQLTCLTSGWNRLNYQRLRVSMWGWFGRLVIGMTGVLFHSRLSNSSPPIPEFAGTFYSAAMHSSNGLALLAETRVTTMFLPPHVSSRASPC